MDLSQLLNLLPATVAANPWVMLAVTAAAFLYRRRPPAPPGPPPGPAPAPTPGPAPTGRPLLDALLALIRGGAPLAAAAVPVASASPAELVAARRAIDAHLDELRAALLPEPGRPTP